MTQLKVRPPTGVVPWPLILIEGAEKSGKSYAAALLSGSDKVGRTLWIDLGEGSADEYGAISGARYEVIDHDGTWADILGQVEAAHNEAARAIAAGEPPVVLVIDSMTAEWDLLKAWADSRARQRLAKKGRAVAADAEPQISMDLWNDANNRHRRLMTMLMTFPGIVVMTARGKDVAALDPGGRPIEGRKDYKVEGHKNLAFDASAWVRLSRDQAPIVVGVRSVHAGVRPGVDKPVPAPQFTLEWLIFDVLKCVPAQAHVRDMPAPAPERTPEQIRDEAVRPASTRDELVALYKEAGSLGHAGVTVENETGKSELLSDLLVRLGKDRAANGKAEQKQHRRMQALFAEVDLIDADAQRAYCGETVGREITSRSDLTGAEADQVIAKLASWSKQINEPTLEGVSA